MRSYPTLRQLQFFDRLSQRGSFSRAAEDCLVSQSTLSAGIKELEATLGAPLVDRSARSFALTPLGEEVARRGGEILALSEALVRTVETKPPLTGELRLGLIPTIGPFLLPRLMGELETGYPDLRLYLREDLTESLIEGLKVGRVDIAVLALPMATEGLSTTEIAEDPFLFVCRSDHPLAGRETVASGELQDETLMLLEDGHCLRDHALSACRLQRRSVAEAFGATSLLTLAQMVRSGLGTTLLPALAVDQGLAAQAGLRAIRVVDADGSTPSRTIGLAWRHGSGRDAEAKALAAVLARV